MNMMSSINARPVALPVQPDRIPATLKQSASWVCWQFKLSTKGRWTKPPFIATSPRRNAKTDDPSTWSSFDAALAAYRDTRNRFDGIGLVLQGELTGLDLDHVLRGNDVEPWAGGMIKQFSGTYIERSPSGDGIRIFCTGKPLRCGKGGPENRLEVYDLTSPRYLTVTGHAWENVAAVVTDKQEELEWVHVAFMTKREKPANSNQIPTVTSSTLDDDEIIRKAAAANNGTKFSRLWSGDAGTDPSAADIALCNILAFWTRDYAQIDRVFRRSGLMREKWDEMHGAHSYGNRTIEKALRFVSATYSGGAKSDRSTSVPAIVDAGNDDVLVDVNQDNVALIFAKKFHSLLRYSHDRGRWYLWDGTRWREEITRIALDYTRQLTRALNRDGKREFAKASFCEGVEKFAQADRVFAMSGTEWDSDPWLLNTPAGTVDLRTGTMRTANQNDLITKITATSPRSGQPRLWIEFLKQITQGDDELIGFLQRMAGYALTGDTREECLFFVYGPGGNGKGTFLGAIFNILAEFAMNAAMDVFLQSKGERHSTDLAMLRGARLVTASETSEGRAWDEQRLKAMTGNDPITARFMRQDNFTYLPQFKLILVGNNKPVLRTVDDAWRRRFHVIPFTFRPETKDSTLKERLRDEYPEILQWMIGGCLDWQRNGLRPPQRVQDETAAYFEAQDIFTSWMEDCCIVDRAKAATTGDLFRSWSAYCEQHRESAGTSRSFSDRLSARGFRRIKDECGIRGRGFAGLFVVPFSHVEAAQ